MTINDNITLSVFCDGGSRGNPGPAASAFVVTDSHGKTTHQEGFYLGITTNNQAEYQAVIESLKYINTTYATKTQATYFLDSLLVVNQLKGLYRVKDEHLKSKIMEVEKLMQNSPVKILGFTYIPRAQNHLADYLVNQTLDSHI